MKGTLGNLPSTPLTCVENALTFHSASLTRQPRQPTVCYYAHFTEKEAKVQRGQATQSYGPEAREGESLRGCLPALAA